MELPTVPSETSETKFHIIAHQPKPSYHESTENSFDIYISTLPKFR